MVETDTRKTGTLLAIERWEHWDRIQQVAEQKFAMSKQEFEAVLPEYQKYMALLKEYQQLEMFSDAVDTIWHSHLLYNGLYEVFCSELIERMIYHTPELDARSANICRTCRSCTNCSGGGQGGGGGNGKKPAADESAAAFIQAYQQAYGEYPGAIWNRVVRKMER